MALKIAPKRLVVPAKKVVQAPAPNKAEAPAYSANDGFARARSINEERERNRELRANRPFEFQMKPGEGGEKGVVAILVDKVKMPTPPYFHFMHRWGFEQGEIKNEVCI